MGGIRRRAGVALGITGLVVPLTVALGAAPAQAASCTTSTGPYQKQVEKFMGRPVDGKQSPADCKAIQTFQRWHGITPSIGYAGEVTWRTMNTILQQRAAGKNPNAAGKCPTNKGRIACVDLTRQLSWIQDGAKLAYGPVPVRTGRDGDETRTGARKIYHRNINHWSTLYKVRMPYAQFFDGGQAFHSVGKSMYNPPGSRGCVNMREADAKAYWNMLRNGDDVYVYGRKPGT
ncbi:murein L,D-transpeptidase [Streptomyces sp. WAC05374]|uniref:L,D-transpeptidase family protein n=1 Tax=unclassified Streptomyces TaxID=2593676 RepID=UPI000F86B2C3|nr:L,D-transpeptidase [Streptomyces sp. WAC05374]RST14194.1 murein L,D-transpeptidase [Streptomyces sp. WAC05374]TDF43150.1 murein L,D-transpeptidase [Streptomyces sp. WAC05374]TDF50937.1 murein L,D-transpeptidase [Streptomyces sp. WAC05374]TDF52320.1 murein L,D-transpeptidase [Streptomyces sp. WAC05374]